MFFELYAIWAQDAKIHLKMPNPHSYNTAHLRWRPKRKKHDGPIQNTFGSGLPLPAAPLTARAG